VDLQTGLVPGLLSIFPGVLMHGTGLWLAGDTESANMFLFLEAVEVAAFAMGAWATLEWLNAGKLGRATIPASVGGACWFVATWFASIYGSFGCHEIAGYPRRNTPMLTVELGYCAMAHTQFYLNHVMVTSLDFHFLNGFRLSPGLRVGLDDMNYRLELEGALRLWGPTEHRKKPSRDGSYIDVVGRVMYHRLGREHFSVCTSELRIMGRHDMGRVGPSLRGCFIEWQFGYAFEFYDYFRGDFEFGEEGDSIQLIRVGFGVYLGDRNPDGPQGEVQAFYDHRSDEITAGMGPEAEGGLLGAVGFCGFYDFDKHWGVGFEMRAGEGYSLDLTVRCRFN
jgi:hypothetical protein